MPELSYSKSSKPTLTSSVVNISSRKKKNIGCISCFSGCFVMLFVICGIFAGIFAYIYYMDKDEALGSIAVKLLKNQSINISLLTDVNKNQSIPIDEKVAIKITYEKFLSDFDTFPENKQRKIKKNLGILIKKFIQEPSFLQTGPPPVELKELVQILVPNQTMFPKQNKPEIEELAWDEVLKEIALEEEEKKKKKRKWRKKRKYRY